MPHFVMMWSGTSYEVLIKKKEKKKIEQNLLQSTRWSVELMGITFISNCSVQRIRVTLAAKQPILHRSVT